MCFYAGGSQSKLILFFCLFLFACRPSVSKVEYIYHYQHPDYDHVGMKPLSDSLQFKLGENVYNDVKSFNCFREKGISYIAFYDRRSALINVYYLMDQRLYKQISLKKLLKNHQLYKPSFFIKNWDSVFIINKFYIHLFDSSGHRKQSIEFPTDQNNTFAVLESNKPPVFHGNNMYTLVRPYVNDKSINALRRWKVLYNFDLKRGKTQLLYHLPETYQNQYYGYHFLDYNWCYNNHDRFVFSFPADTLLYETDLTNYNHSYFARSRFQQHAIQAIDKLLLDSNKDFQEYATRDSYGSVFFDPFRKYYLRLAQQKITPEAFQAKQRNKQTVLILDEHFRVIGESPWPEKADFESLFVTPDGRLYARTNFKDENALHFVGFAYQENKADSILLSKY